MSATENEKKEYSTLLNNSLRELLDTLGKAHKADILAYSSGHLNHNKLRKLLVRKSNMPQWESSKQKESGPLQKQVSKALVKKMTDAWADFTINTSLITDHPSAESSLFRCPYPQESVKSSITPIGKDRKDNSSRRHRESLKEVEPTDLLLLKPQPVRYDRHNTECTPDQYQITQSYISGLTRTDQFNMLLDFERGILRTQDMQEMESKSEYELYLESVLDNQPAVQHQLLQAQVRGMEKKAVIKQEVEGARQEVLRQQEIARKALEENEQGMRYKLQNCLAVNSFVMCNLCPETCKKHMTALDTKEEHTATAAELVQSKRRQIQAVWDEIQELEKDIKDTMVPIVITNTTEKCIRDTKWNTVTIIIIVISALIKLSALHLTFSHSMTEWTYSKAMELFNITASGMWT
ncbi:hypothetical protein EOD39_3151 [Acipenser ruthenus]|uniref:Uncharacterized protein n=1 Tax=Acipenser ruthenus TaxID=7906 RepID=A0A444UPU4_ACIRT|nr:hypothetical protein EOD39_3151 [Acipenser ruthenus]